MWSLGVVVPAPLFDHGLRVGEARDMRWRDVKFNQDSESIPDPIAVVSVRKTTKTRRARDVQTQPTANATLIKWKSVFDS